MPRQSRQCHQKYSAVNDSVSYDSIESDVCMNLCHVTERNRGPESVRFVTKYEHGLAFHSLVNIYLF